MIEELQTDAMKKLATDVADLILFITDALEQISKYRAQIVAMCEEMDRLTGNPEEPT